MACSPTENSRPLRRGNPMASTVQIRSPGIAASRVHRTGDGDHEWLGYDSGHGQ